MVVSAPVPQAPPKPNSKSTVLKARALYAFTAGGPNELSFKAGDIIEVSERGPAGGWCKGVHGAFPTDYVEFLPADKAMDAIFSSLAVPRQTTTQTQKKVDISSAFEGLDVSATTTNKASSTTALFGNTPVESTSVNQNLKHEVVPSKAPKPKSISMHTESNISTTNASSHTSVSHSSTNKKEPVFAIVKYSRAAGGPTELSITEGETVLVIKQDAEWWYGSSLNAEGKSGYFPGNYVELKMMIPPAPSYIAAPIASKTNINSSNNYAYNSATTSIATTVASSAYSNTKYEYRQEAKGGSINWNELCPGLDGSRYIYSESSTSVNRIPVWQLPAFADLFADTYKHKLTDVDAQLSIPAVKRIGNSVDAVEKALSYISQSEQIANPLLQTAMQKAIGMLKDANEFCAQMPIQTNDTVRCFAFLIGFISRLRGLRIGDSIMIPTTWFSEQSEIEQAIMLILTKENDNDNECFTLAIINTSNTNDHGLNYHSFAVDPTHGQIIRNLSCEVNRLPKLRVLNSTFW